ncbi:AAA family ATPase [Tamilnaduibacter salinus]|uniref:AAA family ATPase n=1 Tax=Tamilnaduibacter salinus TaxID=1484056 RepID=A0A2A2I5H0_9GAMM|nr:AAA family ATPase [Tamilnaduibacter salinus]PAV27261.1 AAA family ATPase [Tamilnaduibacter salinus]
MITSPFLKKISSKEHDKSSDAYPLSMPLFSNGDFCWEIEKPISILVGENGSGKSTLLEAIAFNCGFNLNSGSGNHLYDEDLSPPATLLADHLVFAWKKRIRKGFFFRAESFFNFGNYLDEMAKDYGEALIYGPYGGISLNTLSHGEAFLRLFSSRIVKPGVYLLDEPEAALSPMGQLALIQLLDQANDRNDVQVIMATHSPILMAYPKAAFYMIEDGVLERGEVTDSEHFNLYKQFLANPEEFIQRILKR